MEDLIVKKYVKALLARKDSQLFYESLLQIYPAFSLHKFVSILQAQECTKAEKLKLVLSLLENPSPAFVNFLKLLSQNSRLELLFKITEELKRQRALQSQIYTGILYSQSPLEKKDLEQLQAKLSQKFKINIELENQISQNEGIKISLEQLGYELSFSMQTLKNKMSAYILKTL